MINIHDVELLWEDSCKGHAGNRFFPHCQASFTGGIENV